MRKPPVIPHIRQRHHSMHTEKADMYSIQYYVAHMPLVH